ncbi:MAG: GntR family transcriptional regulator [Desulfobacterales bacterium]
MLNLQSLREQVYEYLRNEMHEGHILPDSILDLNMLSQRLRISKTPLRDALIKLEAEGFVTIMPRRGVVVNSLSLGDVKDFYQIIGAIEGEVVKEVFPRFETDHISAMRQLNADMRDALHTDAFDLYYKLNLAFHDTFLNLSDNKHLRKFIMPMKQRLYDFQQRPYVKKWEVNNCNEHDMFIDMIERGNCEGSVHCIRGIHWSFGIQEGYIREFYKHNADLKVVMPHT